VESNIPKALFIDQGKQTLAQQNLEEFQLSIDEELHEKEQ
jgi:hypothetical protein